MLLWTYGNLRCTVVSPGAIRRTNGRDEKVWGAFTPGQAATRSAMLLFALLMRFVNGAELIARS